MSYQGNGTFLISTAGQPVVTGTTITSTAFNALTADLATGLSTALTKDGQTTPTANIPMGTFKITGLGAGTASTDAAQLGQIQSGAVNYFTAAGTDTYTGTLTPALTAYAAGQQFSFIVPNANTGAATLNLNSLGAKAITKNGTTALSAGDLLANAIVLVEYDGTRFQLQTVPGSSSALTNAHIFVGNASNVATDVAVSGDATIANTGALTVGSIGGKAVTLANTVTTAGNFALTLTQTGATNVTLPTTGTLATLAGAEALTNKTVSGSSNTLSNIALTSLATQAANTALVNATAGAAVPTALALAASTVLGRDSTGNVSALTLSGLTAVSGVLTVPPSGSTLLTEQATTSGTAFDFTIPSTAGWFEVLLDQVGVSGTNQRLGIQLGDAGGIETSGYVGCGQGYIFDTFVTGGGHLASTAQSAPIMFNTGIGSSLCSGIVRFTLEDATNFSWSYSSLISSEVGLGGYISSGRKATSQVTTTVRLTSQSALGLTFNAGAVNVRWGV